MRLCVGFPSQDGKGSEDRECPSGPLWACIFYYPKCKPLYCACLFVFLVFVFCVCVFGCVAVVGGGRGRGGGVGL